MTQEALQEAANKLLADMEADRQRFIAEQNNFARQRDLMYEGLLPKKAEPPQSDTLKEIVSLLTQMPMLQHTTLAWIKRLQLKVGNAIKDILEEQENASS